MSSILVVTSEFNKDLVKRLYQSAQIEFENQIQKFMLREAWKIKFNKSSPNLKQVSIPGAGEIPQAVKWCLDEQEELTGKDYESLKAEQIIAVLALAVIIRGQTAHFDFLKNFLQTALWDLQKTYSCPIVFSVLFLENKKQFQDRIIRGSEGMNVLLKMLDFQL